MAEELDGGLGEPQSIGPVPTALAIVLTLAALGWALDIYRYFGLLLIDEQFNAFMLAVALGLVYLTKRARKKAEKPTTIERCPTRLPSTRLMASLSAVFCLRLRSKGYVAPAATS
jgi:hypothetical protein